MPTIVQFDDESVAHETYGDRLKEAGYVVKPALTPDDFRSVLAELQDEQYWIVLDIMTDDDLDEGLKLAEGLSPEQLARTCVLTKRVKNPIIQRVKLLPIPDNRVFSKTETSAKVFATIMVKEFLQF